MSNFADKLHPHPESKGDQFESTGKLLVPLSVRGSAECARALISHELGERSHEFASYVSGLVCAGLSGAGVVARYKEQALSHPLEIATQSQLLKGSSESAPCFWRSAGDFFLYYWAFPEALPQVRSGRPRGHNFREAYPLDSFAQPYYARAATELLSCEGRPDEELSLSPAPKVLLTLAERVQEVVEVLPRIRQAILAAAG
jgi:hypothetical protein